MSLFPTIMKPSRITSDCANLIDNIFTNSMESNAICGLLMSDITDHLPVFSVYEGNYRKRRESKEIKFQRIRTEESIAALGNELLIGTGRAFVMNQMLTKLISGSI